MTITKTPETVENILVITLEPSDYTQQCPCCHSTHVIRKGNRGYRSVRHLPIFEYVTQLQLPKIQMQCRKCQAYFSWDYCFVQGKSRFTNGFKEKVASDTVGSTVTHTARNHKLSYSNCERIFKKHLEILSPLLEQKAQSISSDTSKLVLGIDDFAIRIDCFCDATKNGARPKAVLVAKCFNKFFAKSCRFSSYRSSQQLTTNPCFTCKKPATIVSARKQ